MQNFDPFFFDDEEIKVEEKEDKIVVKKKKSPLKILAIILATIILCTGSGMGGAYIYNNYIKQEDSKVIIYKSLSVDTEEEKEGNTSKNYASVYAENVDSTVEIYSTSISYDYYGRGTESQSAGSGFFLTDDGYIITNYHVIDGSQKIIVRTFNGMEYEASIVGYDESNDIAVIKVEGNEFKPVVLGNSSKMNVGDEVMAIGNPLGSLSFSLTTGVVSAQNRKISLSSGITMNLIQTDCPINSGNSGGALFNLNGEVFGITNAKYSSNSSSEASIDNIGFAIPIEQVLDVIEKIIQTGYKYELPKEEQNQYYQWDIYDWFGIGGFPFFR